MTRLTKPIVRYVPYRNGLKGGMVVIATGLEGGDGILEIRQYRKRVEGVSISFSGLQDLLLSRQQKNMPKGFIRMKV